MNDRRLLTRRDFLKIGALSLGALAAYPLEPPELDPPTWRGSQATEMVGRVTRGYIYAHRRPDEGSERLYKIERDTLLPLLDIVDSASGPAHNRRWYRLDHGYAHSAYLQRVENASLNEPLTSLPAGGLLGRVTVPYTQAIYQNRQGELVPLYRLYMDSLHWISGLAESPQGESWYTLSDDWPRIQYSVPAVHLRPVPFETLAPVNPHVPPGDKRIQVSLERQTLSAYEGQKLVLRTQVSTGRRFMETPRGEFRLNRKAPSRHMGNGAITADLDAYELVGVPWVSFFHTNGVAFHGAYWHDNFGAAISQGCINMRPREALWLFRWSTPFFVTQVESKRDWQVEGEGTVVQIGD